MKKESLPTICVDQHIAPSVADAFRSYFRVIEVSKSGKFRGRDERDFLPALYRENAVFVTSDEPFADEVVDTGTSHAGIIFIPAAWTADEKQLLAHIVSGWIQAGAEVSRFEFRNTVLYPADDGLHSIISQKDKLEMSWDHAFEDI